MNEPRHRSDQELTTAISDELTWNPTTSADHLRVVVTDGAVTLSGHVASLPEKDSAVQATLRIPGVTAIADEIVVPHHWRDRTDSDIARDAGQALESSTVVPQGIVKATVREHCITLTGEVAWHYEREEAVRCVATLRGVTSVRNLITIGGALSISPTAQIDIASALDRRARPDGQHIDVDVTVAGSEVTLTGTVTGLAERRDIEDTAWFTPGVTNVIDKITVAVR
jgi:osmotically-inducible protein OsmY